MTNTTSFDEQANEYDAWFEKHHDLYLAELEAVRSFIPASGSGVEIGVGTGVRSNAGEAIVDSNTAMHHTNSYRSVQ